MIFTILVTLVFLGFGISFDGGLHGGSTLFCLWLPIHLFSDENLFHFAHPECPERTPLFGDKSLTVSHKGPQLHPCVAA